MVSLFIVLLGIVCVGNGSTFSLAASSKRLIWSDRQDLLCMNVFIFILLSNSNHQEKKQEHINHHRNNEAGRLWGKLTESPS